MQVHLIQVNEKKVLQRVNNSRTYSQVWSQSLSLEAEYTLTEAKDVGLFQTSVAQTEFLPHEWLILLNHCKWSIWRFSQTLHSPRYSPGRDDGPLVEKLAK